VLSNPLPCNEPRDHPGAGRTAQSKPLIILEYGFSIKKKLALIITPTMAGKDQDPVGHKQADVAEAVMEA